MQAFIAAKREEIAELCRKHHVRRLAVFGSAVREDFDPERSDVDLRIEFDSTSIERYADNYFELQEALVRTLGREVDIISGETIQNPFFRKEIEDTQVTVYAA